MSNEFSSENLFDNENTRKTADNINHIEVDDSDRLTDVSLAKSVDGCPWCLSQAMHNDIEMGRKYPALPMRIRMVPHHGLQYKEEWRKEIELFKNIYDIHPEIQHHDVASIYEILSRMFVAHSSLRRPTYQQMEIVTGILKEHEKDIIKKNFDSIKYKGPEFVIIKPYIQKFANVIVEVVSRNIREGVPRDFDETSILVTIEEHILLTIDYVHRVLFLACPYPEWLKIITDFDKYRNGQTPHEALSQYINEVRGNKQMGTNGFASPNINVHQKTNSSDLPTSNNNGGVSNNQNTNVNKNNNESTNSSNKKSAKIFVRPAPYQDNGKMDEFYNYDPNSENHVTAIPRKVSHIGENDHNDDDPWGVALPDYTPHREKAVGKYHGTKYVHGYHNPLSWIVDFETHARNQAISVDSMVDYFSLAFDSSISDNKFTHIWYQNEIAGGKVDYNKQFKRSFLECHLTKEGRDYDTIYSQLKKLKLKAYSENSIRTHNANFTIATNILRVVAALNKNYPSVFLKNDYYLSFTYLRSLPEKGTIKEQLNEYITNELHKVDLQKVMKKAITLVEDYCFINKPNDDVTEDIKLKNSSNSIPLVEQSGIDFVSNRNVDRPRNGAKTSYQNNTVSGIGIQKNINASNIVPKNNSSSNTNIGQAHINKNKAINDEMNSLATKMENLKLQLAGKPINDDHSNKFMSSVKCHKCGQHGHYARNKETGEVCQNDAITAQYKGYLLSGEKDYDPSKSTDYLSLYIVALNAAQDDDRDSDYDPSDFYTSGEEDNYYDSEYEQDFQ